MNKINYQAKQNQRHGNIEHTDSCKGEAGGEDWLKEGEGTSQRTCMKDPRTWAMVWRLTVGVGGGLGREAKGEKLGKL